MLSRKQYWLTLLTAVIVFFVMLMVTAWYYAQRQWAGSNVRLQERPVVVAEAEKPVVKTVMIMPQTKITIKIEDLATKKEEKTTLDASSLLGLSEEELAERFDDYTIETFNEKEVCLSKTITSKRIKQSDGVYVLGVDGENVCIKEKASSARPVKIDYQINHLSSYVYSLLLNEEIEINGEQKEALLLNSNTLQKILQDYVGE